ncbi:MAG: hypothetical protein AAB523_01510 [Patescibacteria group bacterium]
MTKKKLFISLSLLLYIVAALQTLALYFFWYWSYWWYDIMMHFLAGLWVGGMVLWAYFFSESMKVFHPVRRSHAYFMVLGITFLIGLSWELFEFSLDTFIIFQQNDLVDTMSDLGMDIVGAQAAAFYVTRARWSPIYFGQNITGEQESAVRIKI